MAVVKMELTCRECGKTFAHRRECHSRAEADRYESWAKDNIDICTDCRRQQQREERAAANAKAVAALMDKYGMSLPDIEGTEKQVAYANSLRSEYIAHNSIAERYCYTVAAMRDEREKLECETKKQGKTVEEYWAECLNHPQVKVAHVALTSTSARELIDTLKQY